MATSLLEQERIIEFDKEPYQDQINSFILAGHLQFKKILKSYAWFNLFFLLLMGGEIFYFFIHLTFLLQHLVLAIHVGLIFATLFSYFTLRMYAQTRKLEHLIALQHRFRSNCEQAIKGEKESKGPILIAQACCKFAAQLHGEEYRIYRSPSWFLFLNSSLEKLNCSLFWKDIHTMKELLLQAGVEEHIKLVRIEPTDLEAHTGLANAYVMLSGIYVDPRTVEGLLEDDRWIPPNKYTEMSKQRFRLIAERAIEEFKILNDYAPDDPWVHAQLAYSYRDLQMPKEEIQEYETILRLCPEDKETLFKLGKLYFEQGYNAKGLQVYERLKRSHYSKVENLIHFYGVYSSL